MLARLTHGYRPFKNSADFMKETSSGQPVEELREVSCPYAYIENCAAFLKHNTQNIIAASSVIGVGYLFGLTWGAIAGLTYTLDKFEAAAIGALSVVSLTALYVLTIDPDVGRHDQIQLLQNSAAICTLSGLVSDNVIMTLFTIAAGMRIGIPGALAVVSAKIAYDFANKYNPELITPPFETIKGYIYPSPTEDTTYTSETALQNGWAE